MLFLNISKKSLDNESYVLGSEGKQHVLIPIHDFNNMCTICPQCGNFTKVDEETIGGIINDLKESEEDLDFDNLTVYCTKCSTERHMTRLKNETEIEVIA